MITLFIPGTPLSANARVHWRTIARDRATFRERAAEAAKPWIEPHGPITHFALVSARRIAKDHRRRDPGSLAEMLKPILDGIVDSGLLVDDNENCIELILHRTRVDKHHTPGIEIVIEPIPGTMVPCP